METLLIINFPSRVFPIKFSYRTPSRHGKKSPFTGIQWNIEIKTVDPEVKARTNFIALLDSMLNLEDAAGIIQ
jgi:hypothetical protein